MKTFLRMTSLAATVAALALTASPAQAAGPVTTQATARVKILKALTLTKNDDIDFGTVVLGAGVWAGEVVEVVSDGNVTCGGGVNLVCDDVAAKTAKFNVTGSNNAVVNLSIPDTVVIQSGANLLTVDLDDSQTSITLTNSSPTGGDDFSFGGTITLASTTSDGSYTGNFNVTAEYQ